MRSVRIVSAVVRLSLCAAVGMPIQSQACEALVGSEYSDPAEIVPLELDPASWHVAFRARNESVARKELVKAQETLADWSELVSWEITFGSRAWDLDALKNQFLTTLGYQCPDVKHAVLRKDERDLIFEWWHGDCFERKPQHQIERLVVGRIGTHRLSYAQKGAKLADAARDAWVQRLGKLRIQSRVPSGELTPIAQARLALWTRDYAKALELLEPRAEAGDAESQEELGGMHAAGWGVPKSYPSALEWFRKAAAQKDAAASYNLGRFYDNGWGVPQDPAEALKWYRTAAELGDADAQGRIAFLLATGPEPKYAEAAKWFKTSAERGHEQAVYWMGRFSEEGWGVPKDPKVAARLYQEAAIAGDPDAQYRLGVLQREGRGVERDAKRAQMWVLRAAMQGNAEAETLYKAEYQPKPKTPAYPDKLPPGVYQAPGGSAPGPASSAPPLPPGLNLPTGQIPAGAKAQ